MNRTARLASVATLALAGIGIAVASQLGPLHPPEGRISDTSPSLSDLAAIPPVATPAAGGVRLFIQSNGTNIEGELADGSIAAFDVEFLGQTELGSGGLPTGRRTYEPIRIRKRIDRASPLLARSFARNEVVQADLRFFREGPGGEPVNYFTIRLTQARITSYSITTETLGGASFTHDEVIEIAASTILWADEINSVEFEDSVSATDILE